MEPGILLLEDGTHFEGHVFGADVGHVIGEVVFNTSMCGYQEIMTDPSYAGQVVTFTSVHIGNYGISPADLESSGIQARGMIVRSLAPRPSNHRSDISLPDWLAKESILGLAGIDTRALTRHLRDNGVKMGVIARGGVDDIPRLKRLIEDEPDYGDVDFVAQVRCPEPTEVCERPIGDGTRVTPSETPQEGPHVVVLDFGVKHSILRNLLRRGARVTLVPSTSNADDVMALSPAGVLVSNGPGDPALLDDALTTVRQLAENVPTYGICLGHQLLARAFGGETFKLTFGHRGPNQPVKDLRTGKVEMTSQNHGYAVAADGLSDDLEVTHINLNDGTVEGFRHRELDVLAVQYHPEAGPGPHDAENFFDQFMTSVRG